MKYCKHCDLFVGYGALGVCRQPVGKDEEWIRTHCWGCGSQGELRMDLLLSKEDYGLQ